MSGHSKWSTIKHQKGAAGKRRGLAFSKAVRLITMAVKEGKSPDPENNFKLRLAMERAKAINMPKDNISRAIERAGGGGEGGELGYSEVFYEGFGPAQAAILIECVTDNKNRTLSLIKNAFESRGFSLGSPGSAGYLFNKKGQVTVAKGNNPEAEQLRLMDFNPEEIVEAENGHRLFIQPGELKALITALEGSGFQVLGFSQAYIPQSSILLTDAAQKEAVQKFVAELKELEDVENVYTNIVL